MWVVGITAAHSTCKGVILDVVVTLFFIIPIRLLMGEIKGGSLQPMSPKGYMNVSH